MSMSENNENDPLERLLKNAEQTTMQQHHLDDDGFTNRVMAKLPPKKRKTPRALVLLIAVGLGSGVALTSSPHIATLCRSAAMQNWFAALVLFCVVAVLIGASTQEAWSSER
jgi:hypothetical protein